jgi:hypothetical protein
MIALPRSLADVTDLTSVGAGQGLRGIAELIVVRVGVVVASGTLLWLWGVVFAYLSIVGVVGAVIDPSPLSFAFDGGVNDLNGWW